MSDAIASRQIGFPAEPSGSDRPVILTPELSSALVRAGFEPLSEPRVGERFDLPDDALAEAGVRFGSRKDVFAAPLLLKYKPFSPHEISASGPGQTLAALFHAEGRPDLLRPLLSSRVRAYSLVSDSARRVGLV